MIFCIYANNFFDAGQVAIKIFKICGAILL